MDCTLYLPGEGKASEKKRQLTERLTAVNCQFLTGSNDMGIVIPNKVKNLPFFAL
jgi:hypothetical protein